MKKDWETIIPKKSVNHVNEWADYIELKCLMSNEIVSKSDILDIISDAEILGVDKDDKYIDSVNGTVADAHMRMIEDAFLVVESRLNVLKEKYPFIIKSGCLEKRNDYNANEDLYTFLLLSSCTRQVGNLQNVTSEFEKLCAVFLEGITFVGAENIFTGTASSTKLSAVYDKVKKIAGVLNSDLTNKFDNTRRYKSASGGDGGVDIVSIKSIGDNNPFLPAIFCQCTCSRETWERKQDEVGYDLWRDRIASLARFIPVIFVPFSLCGADGKLENPSDIRVCYVDRLRIMQLSNAIERERYIKLISEVIEKEINISA